MKQIYSRLSRTFTGRYKQVLDGAVITLVLWTSAALLLILIIHILSTLSGLGLPTFMPLCQAITYLLIGLLGLIYGLQRLIEERLSGNSLVATIITLGGGLFFLLSGSTILLTR